MIPDIFDERIDLGDGHVDLLADDKPQPPKVDKSHSLDRIKTAAAWHQADLADGIKGRWVTMPANGEGGGGTHVYLDDAGNIEKGPSGTVGKRPDQLNRRRRENPKPPKVARPRQQVETQEQRRARQDAEELAQMMGESAPDNKPQLTQEEWDELDGEIESGVSAEMARDAEKESASRNKIKGTSKPKHVQLKGMGDVKKSIKEIFGREVDDATIGALANAPDGAKVGVIAGRNEVEFNVEHDGVKSVRTLTKKPDGRLVMHNDFFEIKKDSKYKGEGVKFFANQVQALREAGVSEIETHAAGHNGNPVFNGYYTWPRMGYDGTINSGVIADLPKNIQRKLGNSRSVQKLFSIPGGKEAWKEHGRDIYDATFDLRGDSHSMKVLNAYLEEREKRG